MTESGKDLQKNGRGYSLKHFIYLDRDRLKSYSSQLLDGLVQVRRSTENEGNKSIQSSDEEYAEETREEGNEGEFSLGLKNYAGGISGKNTKKTTNRKGYRTGVNNNSNEFSQTLSEDRIDHDNGYLVFEEELISKGFLKEIKQESELKSFSSLIKITGSSKFIDWKSLLELFGNKEVLEMYALRELTDEEQDIYSPKGFGASKKTNNRTEQIKKQINNMHTLMKVAENFSLGSMTMHTKIGKSDVIGSINPAHLCMTEEQLRSNYVMSGDVELTVVGFVPKRKLERTAFPGMAGAIDLIDVWKEFAGEVDIIIDPIAIYTEISL